ncbi:NAD(P)-dependent alcohol dehydrogenase [Actinomadura fibrosa]|uniref:NAD(P)-dependent alcohol dehydrogenase n=1 Tax=Actinomadura fibrosa TaxID=111802 RepID=A0ABW2XSE0_9ACTN|nr:NAD(P)-dependent alcohol dehydrogenase [Actinomadura fibrosa]
MKAAVHSSYGGPEVIRIAEVDRPAVRAGDILVRVHATTVNRTDCAYREARPFFIRAVSGLTRPRRQILGTEFAGVVEEVGDSVTSFAPGDRVFGYNEGPFGAHAEYVAVRASGMVAAMPANVSFAEAAPGTEGSHYALAFLKGGRIEAEQDVLVNGATGAIGSAAVQLLKDAGATVTAVCAAAQLDLVRGLGADRVIDYTAQDFTQDARTYDVVFDTVGRSTFGRCRRLLRPGGTYLSSELGPWGQNVFLPLVTRLPGRRKVRFPFPMNGQDVVRRLADLIESGRFRPVIDRRYPLDRIADAHRYVETGQKIGNVVIEIVPPRDA